METEKTNPEARTDVEKYRYLAALSYLCPVFVAVPLILDKDSKYVRHHANQALCLVLWFAACSIVCVVPFLGWLAGGVGAVAGVVFMIVAVVRTLKREYYEIPWIGKVKLIPED